MFARAALPLFLVATLASGCVSYDTYRSSDPNTKVDVTGLTLSTPRPKVESAQDLYLADAKVTEETTTFVKEYTVDYDVDSLLADYHDDDVFPITQGAFDDPPLGMPDGDLGILWPIAICVSAAVDIAYVAGAVAVDLGISAGAGALDLGQLMISGPYALVGGAFAGGAPDPQTEVKYKRKKERTAKNAKLRYEVVGLPDATGSVTTDSRGRIVLPLRPHLEAALLQGKTPLSVKLWPRGNRSAAQTVSVSTPDVVRSLAGMIQQDGLDRGQQIARLRSLHAQIPEGGSDAREELGRALAGLGFIAGWGDQKALAELTKRGGGVAQLGDGAEVDWSAGKPKKGAPRAVVELAVAKGRGRVVAGEPIEVVVRVKNTGRDALYRLMARTRCALREANGLPILFGKIEAGQAITRKVELPTLVTRSRRSTLFIDLVFSEANDYQPRPVRGKVRLEAAKRPQLALGARVVDAEASGGNGDGVVQAGESIDYHIWVRNSGNGPAKDVSLKLTVDAPTGVDVFGELFQRLGDLQPNEVVEATVNVAIKPTFNGRRIPMLAVAEDRSPFALTTQRDLTLEIDKRAPQKVIAIDRSIYVFRKGTSLFSGAAEGAQPAGMVEPGALRATGELAGYYRIVLGQGEDARRAWIRKKDVKLEAPALAGRTGGAASPSAATAVIREYANARPDITVFRPEPVAGGGPIRTAETQLQLEAIALDPEGLRTVKLFLNGVEVPLALKGGRGIGGARRAPTAALKPGQTFRKLTVRRDLALRAGENRIRIEAVDTEGQVAKTELRVVRAVRTGTTYALVVGIDRYKDAKNITALRYAEADADSFATFLKQSPLSPVTKADNVKVLLGQQATKRAILKAIETHLVNQATYEQDTAIFYFAGHGFSKGNAYFLAGQDCEHDSLLSTGIKREDVQALWSAVRAKRKVFIADACHSGGLKGIRGENDINAGLQTMSEGKGSITLLAAGAKERSHESERLGHGIFTYALVEGLRGAADTQVGNGDGRVSVNELATYLRREVPAMARKEAGAAQNPITRVETEGEIYLAKPKR